MERQKSPAALVWIGAFKLGKGLLLLTLALGLLSMMHKDISAVLQQWIDAFHFDPDNRYIAGILAKAGLLDDHKIEKLSGLTFFYAGIFLMEGTGLMLRKRWAEYLTVFATASLIPIEVVEVVKHFGPVKLTLLIFNVGIVVFLLELLRRSNGGRKERGGGS